MSLTVPLPGATRPRRRPGLLPPLWGLLAGVVLTVSLTTVLWWPHDEVTFRSAAPSSVAYPDGAPYHLALTHRTTLSGGDTFRLVVGRGPTPAYGHWLDVDTALGHQGVTATVWTREGVRIRFAEGHELFVPAPSFLGGR
ncbi:hypothetical protein ABT160_44675 [Streptomyces sp. NPDC001941]|uniref:hypothetical protein n=1 Tax=Streptomyces sp. NPDC001941 TaxID=3154659 RepID=UPI00331A796B